MSVLQALTDAIRDSSVEVIDLTAPLSSETPIIQLPEPFGNTARFGLTEISHYDDRGPAWYWNDIVTGEHTGTHFDAPVHWVTGKDGEDVARVPVSRLIAPAVVLDFSAEAAADPDFLLEIEHVKQWEAEHGPLPEGWLLYRTGWDARSGDQAEFLNANETGPHTPGISVACAKWLAEESPVIGLGTETVGTDAGAAHSFDPPFPLPFDAARGGQVRPHAAAEPGPAAGHRRGRDRGPAAHRERFGVPVPRAGAGRAFLSMRVAEAVGRGLAGLGVNTVFGVVGSGNFHVTNALVAGGARFVAARHEGGAAVMADAWARTTGVPGVVTVHQGPGLTNAMTGIAEAAKSRTPLLVLAAEAPEIRSNFHVDVAGLAAAVGAVGERLYSPASALADAHRAYATALGRRTVILALPLNVQGDRRARPGPVPGAAAGLPDRPGRRGGHRAGRGAARGAAAGVHRGPGRPGPGGRAGTAGRRVRGAAGHLRGGQGPVPRQPVEPGRERRVRHAAGGRADRRRRRHRGLGLLAEHVDDAARQADPAAGHAGAGGRRPGRDRHAPAGAPRRARGRGRDRARRRGRARRVAAARRGTGRRRCGPGSPARDAGGTWRTRTRATGSGSTRARCPSRWTTCCPRSGPWRWIRATSWATRACSCPFPTRRASASRRRSSRSGSAWPRPSGPRSPGRTGWRWPRSATAAR